MLYVYITIAALALLVLGVRLGARLRVVETVFITRMIACLSVLLLMAFSVVNVVRAASNTDAMLWAGVMLPGIGGIFGYVWASVKLRE